MATLLVAVGAMAFVVWQAQARGDAALSQPESAETDEAVGPASNDVADATNEAPDAFLPPTKSGPIELTVPEQFMSSSKFTSIDVDFSLGTSKSGRIDLTPAPQPSPIREMHGVDQGKPVDFRIFGSKSAPIDLTPPSTESQTPENPVFFSSSKRLDITTIPKPRPEPDTKQ